MSVEQWACRWAPSLGALESPHQDVWGTREYSFWDDYDAPTVFCGMYDLRDYLALALHDGPCAVWWAGSDIRNLSAGFAFNDGKLRTLSRLLKGRFTKWLVRTLSRAEHYVENEWERDELAKFGIDSIIVPSFLGDARKYDIEFVPGNEVYLSSGADRQVEYGFQVVEDIAQEVPEITFHLYGAPWETKHKNVIVHGRVPKEVMNEQIKKMQCGLRLNATDGFSEVTAKSVLWGQYPISHLSNRLIKHAPTKDALIRELKEIPRRTTPNTIARDYYLEHLNNYPWNHNRHV